MLLPRISTDLTRRREGAKARRREEEKESIDGSQNFLLFFFASSCLRVFAFFCFFLKGRAMDQLTIAAFQKHISDKYEKVDRERGSAKTFLWFIEEVGELATALNGNDRENLQEEFADVLAWLCTLANINDISLADAAADKYLGEKHPDGHK
jgi:NTP pyrophosphatase (non-canonical NTP hydrolase)